MTYTITRKALDELQDELSNFMDDLDEVNTGYTGRRMYTKTCIAWVHNESELRFGTALLMALMAVTKENEVLDDELFQLVRQEDWWSLLNFIGSGHTDNMGHRVITYYPDLTLQEDE